MRWWIGGLLAGGCVLAAAACRSGPMPTELVAGGQLPSVRGEALDGREWRLPEDLAGAPALLLVGFEMESQFDCDRWLLGLIQAATPIKVLEVPTIPGMVPGLFAGAIDSGMREGIPAEDWAVVVTLYGDDAKELFAFTGGRSDRNARVLLLDATGRLVWHHERGYSARVMADLDARVRALLTPPAEPPTTR